MRRGQLSLLHDIFLYPEVQACCWLDFSVLLVFIRIRLADWLHHRHRLCAKEFLPLRCYIDTQPEISYVPGIRSWFSSLGVRLIRSWLAIIRYCQQCMSELLYVLFVVPLLFSFTSFILRCFRAIFKNNTTILS